MCALVTWQGNFTRDFSGFVCVNVNKEKRVIVEMRCQVIWSERLPQVSWCPWGTLTLDNPKSSFCEHVLIGSNAQNLSFSSLTSFWMTDVGEKRLNKLWLYTTCCLSWREKRVFSFHLSSWQDNCFHFAFRFVSDLKQHALRMTENWLHNDRLIVWSTFTHESLQTQFPPGPQLSITINEMYRCCLELMQFNRLFIIDWDSLLNCFIKIFSILFFFFWLDLWKTKKQNNDYLTTFFFFFKAELICIYFWPITLI